ncbi:hypothetical protein PghCCS26_18840 [Paenibacillus glycanilyticus]|uniref:Uncharacterized protein n=1 Tax=Paenibacillus glycanilyticus TaxID=126569 RepID=A0ABQ6NI32_9BACL|nr:hypothetical protein PghCCS26_18840 [Paenibacillus glycanilyticus]
MIVLLLTYIAYLAISLILMKRYKADKKEKIALCTISLIGSVLWFSILLGHPLDLNALIGWLIETMF